MVFAQQAVVVSRIKARVQDHVPDPHAGRQLSTLTNRYLALLSADIRSTLLLFAQAPVLGLLMLAAFGKDDLVAGTRGAGSSSRALLLVLILAASYLGAANSIREIVRERSILTRERSVGQSATAYILSKALILGLITVAECFTLTYIALLRQGGPSHGVVFVDFRIEIAIAVSLAGLSAMALGLMVSALSGKAARVLTILPIILFAQFVLSGSAFPVLGTAGLDQISYLSSMRWGYAAVSSSANLDKLVGDGCNHQASPSGTVTLSLCDPAHAATKTAWAEDLAALGALTALALLTAGFAIRPIGRPKRK